MSELGIDPDFDYDGFAARLKEAMSPEKVTPFAARLGVPQGTLSKYLKGVGSGPRLDIVAKVASGAGVTLDWLVWGRGDGPDATTVRLPHYDVTLAAGAGAWNESRRRIEDMPVTADFMRSQLRRASATGLSVLEARGDSMSPTIQDRALVIVDERDTRLIDDVFAFVMDDVARLKRFRRLTSGLQIISDNRAYPSEELQGDQLERLQIIGRAIWVGQAI